MIADCSFNAKVAMLHGLFVGYIVETDDDSDLPTHLAWDVESSIPECYPGRDELLRELDSWGDKSENMDECAKLLVDFLESIHSRCELHHDCVAID